MADEVLKIKKLKQLAGVGVWDFRPAATSTLQFCDKNLIYGFNGSGKTTLSRVFGSIEQENRSGKFPSSCSFEVEVSDGRLIKSDGIENPFGKNLLVFNEDFVERNLRWDDSFAEPIFFISESEINASEELKKVETEFTDAKTEEKKLSDQVLDDEKRLKEFKTRVAKRVREAGGGNKYTQSFDARKIEPQYESYVHSKGDLLGKEEFEGLQRLANQDEARPKINSEFKWPDDLRRKMESWRALLRSSLGKMITGVMKEHPGALSWMREGLAYHVDHKLTDCLFCGNALTHERTDELSSIFDATWDRFVEELDSAITKAESERENLRAVYRSLPDIGHVQPRERAEYEKIRPELRLRIELLGKALSTLVDGLRRKREQPTEIVKIPEEELGDFGEDWYQETGRQNSKYASLVGRHNNAFDAFAKEQEKCAEKIERHILAEEKSQWLKLGKQKKENEDKFVVVRRKIAGLQKSKDSLNNAVRKHGVAAEKLNMLLHSYLGHKEISLKSLETGYQLLRSNGVAAQHLSEGERTAIAFCFFIILLDAEGRKKKDLVVIIDDPISSLDTSARTQAFALMSKRTKRVAQVFVLTHNLGFMHMVKRDFVNRQNEVECGLYFLRCTSSGDQLQDKRLTTLEKMPTLLSEYDSEYHYLFFLVYEAQREGKTEFLYLLPNATRKLLEIFTAYAAPDKTNFADALLSGQGAPTGEDAKALERLVQIESHGKVGGALSLPDLTVEESIRAAKAAMEFIKKRDKKHFKAMENLVRRLGKQ